MNHVAYLENRVKCVNAILIFFLRIFKIVEAFAYFTQYHVNQKATDIVITVLTALSDIAVSKIDNKIKSHTV